MLMSFDDVEFRHLKALRAVAEEGSFVGAADVLGFSQAAISQQIAGLEKAVGQSLFDRPGGPKPVTLTPAGRLLLTHADAMVDRLTVAERELSDLATGTAGRLIIGTYQSVSVQPHRSVRGQPPGDHRTGHRPIRRCPGRGRRRGT